MKKARQNFCRFSKAFARRGLTTCSSSVMKTEGYAFSPTNPQESHSTVRWDLNRPFSFVASCHSASDGNSSLVPSYISIMNCNQLFLTRENTLFCVRGLFTTAHEEEGRKERGEEIVSTGDHEGHRPREEDSISSIEEISLRKTASAFLMLCHPDKTPTLPQTKEPKEVNLRAVQSLNGFIDTVDHIITGLTRKGISNVDDVVQRAVEAVTFALEDQMSDSNTQSSTISTQTTFGMIEFMVPTGEGAARLETALSSATSEHDQTLLRSPRHKNKLIYTRRAIQLRIPSKLLLDIHELLSSLNRPETVRRRQNLSMLLKRLTLREIVKLLKAAGLPISYTLSRLVFGKQSRGTKGVIREMNIDGQYGSEFDEHEEVPTFEIDWDLEMKRYEVALKTYDHDIATLGVLDQEVRLREDIIAGVVSRVRYIGDVSGLDQVITLRRITMLLQDNFQKLQMEDYLRLWQSLVIVLEDDGSGVIPSSNFEGGKLSANSIRKRRVRKRGSSGYTFALLDEDLMVVTVPLSFTDEDFVGELSRHLYDFDVNSYAVEM